MLGFIGQLSIGQRLVSLAIIALTLTAVPTLLYGTAAWEDLQETQHSVDGIEPAKALLDVIRLTQQHRGMTAVLLAGNAEIAPKRVSKNAEAQQAYDKLSALLQSTASSSVTFNKWDDITRRWQEISRQLAGNALSRKESFAVHNGLVNELIEMAGRIDIEFGLSYDPAPAVGETVHAVLHSVPLIGDAMGKIRAQGSAALNASGQQASKAEKISITALVSIAKSHMSSIGEQFESGLSLNPMLENAILDKLRKAKPLSYDALETTNREVLKIEAMRLLPTTHFAIYSKAIDAQVQFSLASLNVVSKILQARIETDQNRLAGLAALMALFLLGGFAAGVIITQSIIRQVGGEPRLVVAMANAVSGGELTAELDVKRAHHDSIAAAMSRMQQSLYDIVKDVRESSRSIAEGGRQLLSANMQLNQQTIDHAAHMQETAAAVVQITETVRQTSEAVTTATKLAEGANGAASKGGEIVQQVYDTMQSIKDSSSRIQNIIGVVDEIAFQTNILSLNAAVEAARAGELGRGFAVVATEVRSLALRSSEAAQQVRGLIQESVENVATGSKLTDQAEASTKETIEQVRSVNELLTDIANASTEQTQGIDRIGVAMTSIDDTTQQNMALVEESAASTELLDKQADALANMVAKFKLHDNEPADNESA